MLTTKQEEKQRKRQLTVFREAESQRQADVKSIAMTTRMAAGRATTASHTALMTTQKMMTLVVKRAWMLKSADVPKPRLVYCSSSSHSIRSVLQQRQQLLRQRGEPTTPMPTWNQAGVRLTPRAEGDDDSDDWAAVELMAARRWHGRMIELKATTTMAASAPKTDCPSTHVRSWNALKECPAQRDCLCEPKRCRHLEQCQW